MKSRSRGNVDVYSLSVNSGCLCVNPGRTGRFAAGGTYSVIHAVSSSSSPNGDVELCGIVSRLSRPSS